MRHLSELMQRLRALTLRRRLERDLDDELAFHLAMREEELRLDGLAAMDARDMARRRFGNPALLKEQTRDVWLFSWLESWVQDLRFASLTVRRAPGFTLAAVLMLAVSVGVTTATFTLVDALALRPVPFRNPEQLALLYMGGPTGGRSTVAPSVLRAWRESPAFEGAESAVPHTALIEVSGTVFARAIAHVTPGLFDMLGAVRPIHGRLFNASEGVPGTTDRVLLSEDVWRGLYHADPSLVGRRVTIDGEALLVVGILPAEFRFPNWDTVIWRAFDAASIRTTQVADFPRAYVRFAAEVPRTDALRLARDAARAADARNNRLEPKVRPVAGEVLDPYYRRAVPLMAGGVMLVFVVLCANMGSLMLARLTERQREFSMRSALGAARSRVIRQVFVECGVIGLAGAAAGVGLAWALVSLARGFLPESILLRTLNPLNVDGRALVVASASGVIATAAAGMLPAWIGTRVDLIRSMRVSERGGTETRSSHTITRGLLVVEVALACTLLAGAVLLVRSFVNLAGAERGLDPTGVIRTWISLERPALRDPASRASAVRAVEEHMRRLPRVRQLAWSQGTPPRGGRISWGDWQSGLAGAAPVNMMVDIYSVGPEFFELYGIRILRGRTFDAAGPDAQVLVGERFANALWPDTDPLGQSFTFEKERFEVIGIVGEIHHPSLDATLDGPEFYTRFTGVDAGAVLSLRCEGPCPDAALVRQRLRAVHPDLVVVDARRVEDDYFAQIAQPRAAAALGFAFAAIALLAAAAGLFSVLTYSVARRRREFGIRIALGASSDELHRLVLRESLIVALSGIAIGAVASWMLARHLATLQYGVTISDPGSWTAVAGLIAATTLFASWRPARAASNIDPVLLLKEQ